MLKIFELREHQKSRKEKKKSGVMNYDLAIVNPEQKPCLFYPHGIWEKIQNNSGPVSLIN